MPHSSDPAASALGQLSDSDLIEAARAGFEAATLKGSLHFTLLAALTAGRLLLAIKSRCRHGEFTALKRQHGFDDTSSSRFINLAESPELAHCANYADTSEAIRVGGWKSMRSVLEGHGLMSPPTPKSAKVVEPVADIQIEDVDLCRYSGGYLVRISAGTDPDVVAQRVEFSAGTRDAAKARLIRDAVYRAFEAVGILPPRSKAKWEAYVANDDDLPPMDDAAPQSDIEATLAAYRERVIAYSLNDEFADLMASKSDAGHQPTG